MSLKQIQVSIPNDKVLPDIISSFSPEENYLMLKIGCETLLEGRRVATNLSNIEIYKKIENDFKGEIEGLNNEIKIEKGTSLKMQERITKIYEAQIEQLNKKLESVMVQLKTYEKDLSASLQEEVSKVKQKYDMLLEEKDRQNQLNREVFDKAEKMLTKQINKTSISLGDDGEQIFENLADTFKDFAGYKIENKAKQSHKGDFHLYFQHFNILVDSKNYTGSVQKKEVLKIEADLNANSNIDFAWLVSLNSNICEYNKFPIMTKWITTDDGVKCILFINNLLDHKEPRNVLRQAWQMCEEFYKLTKKVNKEDGELEEYREKNLIFKKQVNNLQERALEIRRSMNVSYNILKNMDNDLIEMLSLVTDEIINEKYKLDNQIKKWWNNNIENINDDSKMTSTEIWNKFKKDNKEYILDNKITIEIFKDVLTSNIVKSSNYIEKGKKGAIEFIGFKWREKEIKEIKDLIIENIVLEKSVKKEKQNDFYFDEETDNRLLQEYANQTNDIITMSNSDIRPWQIISLLMRYKLIKKRDDARGYDKYKETEEYKNKLNKI